MGGGGSLGVFPKSTQGIFWDYKLNEGWAGQKSKKYPYFQVFTGKFLRIFSNLIQNKSRKIQKLFFDWNFHNKLNHLLDKLETILNIFEPPINRIIESNLVDDINVFHSCILCYCSYYCTIVLL